MKNLFSSTLYITVSFVSQYLKTTIYSFSLTTPTQNTTPIFSPTPISNIVIIEIIIVK